MEYEAEWTPLSELTSRRLQERVADMLTAENGEVHDFVCRVPEELQAEVGADEVKLEHHQDQDLLTICTVRLPQAEGVAYAGNIYLLQSGGKITKGRVHVEYLEDERRKLALQDQKRKTWVEYIRALESMNIVEGVDKILEELRDAERTLASEKGLALSESELYLLAESDEERQEARDAFVEAEAIVQREMDEKVALASARDSAYESMFRELLSLYVDAMGARVDAAKRSIFARAGAIMTGLRQETSSISELEGIELERLLARVANL